MGGRLTTKGKVFELGMAVINLEKNEVTVEIITPDDEAYVEPIKVYVGIELPTLLYKKVAKAIIRRTGEAFKQKQKDLKNDNES